RFAQCGPRVGADGQVADTLGGVFVDDRGFVAAIDLFYSVQGNQRRPSALELVGGQVHPGKRAEGAVVDDIRIGDRQYDTIVRHAGSLEHVLEIDHPRLGVHAVISGDAHSKTRAQICREQLVEAAEELVGHVAAWRLFVLNVVGQADIQQVEAHVPVHGQANLHGVVAQVPIVDTRIGPAHEPAHVG